MLVSVGFAFAATARNWLSNNFNALQWRSQYSRIIQVATTTTTVSVENLLVG
ncbi:MAG: hypothetical protein KME55_33795 [Nostoc indistinguendum CM1-VF10]|nr:hypothetical protein [Nostoc indistinguendum CM1-VF10]